MPIVTPLRQFKSLARKGGHLPADLRLRKQMLTTTEQVGERVIRFTISTPAIDRDGDTIAVGGWDLTEYRQNPVVLFAHNADRFPIGKSVNIDVTEGRLWAEVEFVPPDVPCAGEQAEAAFQLCKGGFLNAASVGFHPVEFEFSADRMDAFGVDFTQQRLLEWSIVTVPSNPEALIDEPPDTDPGLASTPEPDVPDTGQARSADLKRRKAAFDLRARAILA